MLKKLFLGLSIALMSTYVLQNPSSINSINRKNAKNTQMEDIQVKPYDDKDFILEEDDNIRYNYIVDCFTIDNAQIKITPYNDDTTFNTIELNIDNNYSLIRFFVGGWDDSQQGSSVDTTLGINAYYTKLAINNDNELIINGSDYIPGLTRYNDLQQYANIDTFIKIEFSNCLINVIEIFEEDLTNFNRIDFDNWVGDSTKYIDNNFINYINTFLATDINNKMSIAFENGKSNGYEDGYYDGLQDNENAYNQGYEDGIGDNIIPKNIIGWFRILAKGIQQVLDIEILPYMKVSYIISIPIMFGLILFIIRLVRGD